MLQEIKTETPNKSLEIGSKVLYKQQVYPTKADDDIKVGMIGIVCDIDDNTWFNESAVDISDKLTVYVVFHVPNGLKGGLTRDMIAVYDWFDVDELEVLESV